MSKHTPFTSEPSHPHGNPPHVEVYHYGPGGQKQEDMTVKHITDKGMVDLGRQKQEHDKQQKNK